MAPFAVGLLIGAAIFAVVFAVVAPPVLLGFLVKGVAQGVREERARAARLRGDAGYQRALAELRRRHLELMAAQRALNRAIIRHPFSAALWRQALGCWREAWRQFHTHRALLRRSAP